LSFVFLGLAFLVQADTGAAPVPQKICIIHVQDAILRTKEGQKAIAALPARFNPKKAELDQKQNEIAQLQDQLRKGENTLNDEAKQKITLDIERKTKAINRETEDAQADLDEQQRKVMQEIGERVMAVLTKYAKDNGYSLIIDVSSQQTPVLYAAAEVDITSEIIELYDKSSASPAVTTSAPAGRPAMTSAAPGPAK
jgi:outer membrane protein